MRMILFVLIFNDKLRVLASYYCKLRLYVLLLILLNSQLNFCAFEQASFYLFCPILICSA